MTRPDDAPRPPAPVKPDDFAQEVLSGENARGEVAGCPTGLSGLLPNDPPVVPPPSQPTVPPPPPAGDGGSHEPRGGGA